MALDSIPSKSSPFFIENVVTASTFANDVESEESLLTRKKCVDSLQVLAAYSSEDPGDNILHSSDDDGKPILSKFRKNGFFGNAKVAIIPVFEHCRQIEMPEPIDVEEYELCAGILKKVNEIERREHTLVNPVSGEKIIKITREDVSFGEKAINRIIEIELEKHPDWNISQSNDESLPIQK